MSHHYQGELFSCWPRSGQRGAPAGNRVDHENFRVQAADSGAPLAALEAEAEEIRLVVSNAGTHLSCIATAILGYGLTELPMDRLRRRPLGKRGYRRS
jgi:hypothetical protein